MSVVGRPSTWSANASPGASSTGGPPSEAVRTSGPRVSSISATGTSQRVDASRTRAMRAACSVWLPCERLSRATLIPAPIIASSISGASHAGPMVAITLVRPGPESAEVVTRAGYPAGAAASHAAPAR